MTERPQDWVPPEVDPTHPSMARVYDYMLGGAHNFAVDRAVADQTEKLMPGSRQIARLNRAFLGRAVRFLVESGVRQFLDIGSGVPTVGNVHEIAHKIAPDSRVMYVDKDPVAVAHSQLILADTANAGVIRADMRDPEEIIGHPRTRELLNFDEPVAVLMVFMLHWVADQDDPYSLVARYMAAMPSGSYLVVSHVTADHREDQIGGVAKMIEGRSDTERLNYRTHSEVLRFFEGMDLVEPGLVGCGVWRPAHSGDFSDDVDFNRHVYAGVARKP